MLQDGLLLAPLGVLGSSLVPACGVGCLLLALVLFTLKDAAQRGRLGASTFKALNLGGWVGGRGVAGRSVPCGRLHAANLQSPRADGAAAPPCRRRHRGPHELHERGWMDPGEPCPCGKVFTLYSRLLPILPALNPSALLAACALQAGLLASTTVAYWKVAATALLSFFCLYNYAFAKK